jgi:hypothetical protein
MDTNSLRPVPTNAEIREQPLEKLHSLPAIVNARRAATKPSSLPSSKFSLLAET